MYLKSAKTERLSTNLLILLILSNNTKLVQHNAINIKAQSCKLKKS